MAPHQVQSSAALVESVPVFVQGTQNTIHSKLKHGPTEGMIADSVTRGGLVGQEGAAYTQLPTSAVDQLGTIQSSYMYQQRIQL